MEQLIIFPVKVMKQHFVNQEVHLWQETAVTNPTEINFVWSFTLSYNFSKQLPELSDLHTYLIYCTHITKMYVFS